MAVYRLGYLPADQVRPAIDWSSHERKRPSQYVYRDTCATPERGWDEDAGPSSPGAPPPTASL